MIIFAFTCPAGYDVLKASADPTTDCTASAKDTQFTLSGNGISPLKRKITSQNNTDFSPLEAGDYELTETLPAGVTSAFIGGCNSTGRDFSSYLFKPFARVGSNGKVALTILDGEKLECDWYNVPAKKTATAGATVKITVRDCPGQSVNLSQCAPGASGVQFTLTPVGNQGTAATLTTDASGIASGPVKDRNLQDRGNRRRLVPGRFQRLRQQRQSGCRQRQRRRGDLVVADRSGGRSRSSVELGDGS